MLRRQRQHLAIADAIERLDKTAAATRPSEIANHLLQAGAGADAERTLGYLERTADRAMDAAAFEEALRAIDDALSLVGDDDEGRRGKLLERKGWTVRALGEFEACIAIWEEVLPIYQRIGEVDAAAKLCWEMGYQLIWLNRFADGFATYARVSSCSANIGVRPGPRSSVPPVPCWGSAARTKRPKRSSRTRLPSPRSSANTAALGRIASDTRCRTGRTPA